MLPRLKIARHLAIEALWALFWLGLPLTSFPILGWVVNSQAAPFSAIPLAALLLLWFLPVIIQGATLPGEAKPILGFGLAAIASSAAVYFLQVVPFEGNTYASQSIRALFTLAIGLSFYLLTSSWFKNEPSFERALRWIHIGGAIMLLWGLAQVVIIFTAGGHFPSYLEKIRTWLVIQYYAVREGNRVASLTYEPSWFAHVLNMLYLPLWLSATFLRKSVFRVRLLRLSIENILLGVGLIEFILSHPRVGLAAFLLMAFVLLLRIALRVSRSLGFHLSKRMHRDDPKHPAIRIMLTVCASLIFLLGFVLIAYAGISLAARFDERFAAILTPIPKDHLFILAAMNEGTLLYLGQRLMFMERVVYWLGGWHIFHDYPILGVGLGNAGFFFADRMPPIGWMTTELRDLFYRLGYMINTKSYWIRILAETGLVGFAFFTTWLIGIWRSARFLATRPEKTYQLISLAGQLALVAFLIEGFSLDSFALPYMWILPGMVSAARMVTMSSKPIAGESPAKLPG